MTKSTVVSVDYIECAFDNQEDAWVFYKLAQKSNKVSRYLKIGEDEYNVTSEQSRVVIEQAEFISGEEYARKLKEYEDQGIDE